MTEMVTLALAFIAQSLLILGVSIVMYDLGRRHGRDEVLMTMLEDDDD